MSPDDGYPLFIGNASGRAGWRFTHYADGVPSARRILYATSPQADLVGSLMRVRYEAFESRTGRMKLDLRDAGISRELFLTGVHEVHSTQQFKEEMKPGMVLLEIGGNIGYFALLGARRVRPGGRVLALEPSPANVKSLEENTKLNGLEDVVKIYPFAAGRQSGILPFYVVSKSNLCGFVNREGPGIKLLEEVPVRLVSVDQVVEQEAVQVDYFRMDVEGFETEVIEGMTGTLSGQHAPSGGFIEVHSELLNRKGISARSFIERMYELGYEIKTARYRRRWDVVVRSNFEFLDHPCSEIGYWETFFRRH